MDLSQLAMMLGLPEDATFADCLAAVGELLRMVAEGAAEKGADATADAADAAAEATDEAAAAAEGDQAAIDEAAAAEEPAAASAIMALSKEVQRLNARLDKSDRESLMSTLIAPPGVKKWLATQPIEVVRSYAMSAPKAPAIRQPKPGAAAPVDMTAEEIELCRITGQDPDELKAYKASRAGKTGPVRLKAKTMLTDRERMNGGK